MRLVYLPWESQGHQKNGLSEKAIIFVRFIINDSKGLLFQWSLTYRVYLDLPSIFS